MSPLPTLDPLLIKSAILLLPVAGAGIALLIKPPTYFQAVGLMLAVLLNIPYLLLLNILAEKMGWWTYLPSQNTYFNIPIEVLLGWSFFWGALLPYTCRAGNIFIPVLIALIIDIWCMPQLTSVFTLGRYWLLGEITVITLCLVPSLIIFRLTASRKLVLCRALLQSYIWGGWVVFFLPSIALTIEHKSIFDIFFMPKPQIIVFLISMGISMCIGYLALFEFALRGKGTPIPFDPPVKLVATGIYSIVANPLQISTLLMLLCITITYQSRAMLIPVTCLVLYCEWFVRWHHSVDIEKRFGTQWHSYKQQVNNWIP